MIHSKFGDISLSQLGMGTMRLPTVDGDNTKIDEAATAEMVAMAMAAGVNYYDTAWGYHGGQSERVIGRVLSAYPRESYYLASKFPGYDLANMGKVEEIFEEQLRKCGVGYFDFYLIHNVCELNIDGYLDPANHILAYLTAQKANGRIRHLGFSAHGSIDTIRRFLAVYGSAMEFGQLQLNYLDWTFQAGEAKAALLREWGIPIWVMEPLRGGSLAKLSDADTARLAALRPDEGVPAWAFRFLQSIPGVTVVLSGMSNAAQLADNLRTFEMSAPLNEAEMAAILDIARGMLEKKILPCTACRYCTDHCPQGLDIPWLLSLYNEHAFTGGGFIAPMALSALPEDKHPSACLGCRSCEAVCPQQLKISEALADFAARLG